MTRDLFHDELASFGNQLGEAARRADKRRRTARRGTGAATSAIVVAAAAVLVVPGTSRLDPVAEARAALGSGSEILHFRATYSFDMPGAARRSRSTSPAQEVWATASGPVRWRTALPSGPANCGLQGTGALSFVAPSQQAYANHTLRQYSPWSQLLIVSPKDPAGRAFSPFPSLPKELGDDRDPASALRVALDRGLLKDDGITEQDGRRLRLLTGQIGKRRTIADPTVEVNIVTGKRKKAHPGQVIEQRPTQLTYTVDADTFAPVELKSRNYAQWFGASRKQRYAWLTNTVRFETFQRLAPTPTNLRLLALQYPASTKVRHLKPQQTHGMLPPRISMSSMHAAQADMRRCRKANGQPPLSSEPTITTP